MSRNTIAALLALSLASPALAQTTRYVDVNGTPPGSGTQADPWTSIQYGIAEMDVGDTLLVAPGLYSEEVNSTVNGTFKRPVIRSTGGPEVTIISGSPSYPNFAVVELFDSVIDGFTITCDDYQTCIGIATNSVTIENCLIQGCGTGLYTADHTDFFNSTATDCWRGIDNAGFFSFLDMRNSVSLENWGSDLFDPDDYSTVQYSALSSLQPGPGNMTGPAEFWDPGNGDWKLRPESTLIDAGDPALTDPDGSRVDMGVFPYDRLHAPAVPTTYCTAKTNSEGCVPAINALGTPSASGGFFWVSCDQVLNNKTGLFFYGYASKASPFQGGWLCVRSPAIRTPIQNSGGNPPPDDCSGSYTYDFGARIHSNVDATLAPGVGVFGQFWFRDPAAGGFTTGRSDGVAFVVVP